MFEIIKRVLSSMVINRSRRYWEKRAEDYNNRILCPAMSRLYSQALEFCLEDQPKRILDFGCAGGDFLKMINNKNPDIETYGIDISSLQIDMAKYRVPKAIFYHLKKNGKLPFPDNFFDATVSIGVLMYLSEGDLISQLSEIHRVSKKIVSVEYDTSYFTEGEREIFWSGLDGRYEYNFREKISEAGFLVNKSGFFEFFRDPVINVENALGFSYVVGVK